MIGSINSRTSEKCKVQQLGNY